jgi:hypothetical protein
MYGAAIAFPPATKNASRPENSSSEITKLIRSSKIALGIAQRLHVVGEAAS